MIWKYFRGRFYALAPIGVIYYLINVKFSQPFPRYMLPLVPLLAVAAAAAWSKIETDFFRTSLLRKTVLGVFTLSMLVPSVYGDILFLKKDTRTECLEWAQRNISPGAVVVTANRFFSPPLLQTPAQVSQKYALLGRTEKDAVRKKRLDLSLLALQGKPTYNVYFLSLGKARGVSPSFLFLEPRVQADPGALEEIGADYLILNYSERTPEALELKKSMSARLELAAHFSPYWDPSKKEPTDPYASTAAPHLPGELFSRKCLGPYLEVYKIKR